MQRFFKYVLVFVIVLIGYLLFWPVTIEPVAWYPPDNPGLNGHFKHNQKLADSERLLDGVGVGPEDIVAGPGGRLYTGFLDGRIVGFSAENSGDSTVIARSERPLGMDVSPDGSVIWADAYKGLMKYDLETSDPPQLLSGVAGDQEYGFTNDVAVARDGTIYFTDSSSRFSVDAFEKIMLSHSGRGRLLRYDPETRKTRVLEQNLNFPNGLTLTEDHQALLMVETSEYRLRKYPIKKDGSTGEPVTVLEALPGIPDNINRGEDTFWLALPSPRNMILDRLGPYPWLRKIVTRLPASLHPAPQRHPIVLEITEEGQVLRNLQDETGDVALVSSAYPFRNQLYLGSYQEPTLRRHDL